MDKRAESKSVMMRCLPLSFPSRSSVRQGYTMVSLAVTIEAELGRRNGGSFKSIEKEQAVFSRVFDMSV